MSFSIDVPIVAVSAEVQSLPEATRIAPKASSAHFQSVNKERAKTSAKKRFGEALGDAKASSAKVQSLPVPGPREVASTRHVMARKVFLFQDSESVKRCIKDSNILDEPELSYYSRAINKISQDVGNKLLSKDDIERVVAESIGGPPVSLLLFNDVLKKDCSTPVEIAQLKMD